MKISRHVIVAMALVGVAVVGAFTPVTSSVRYVFAMRTENVTKPQETDSQLGISLKPVDGENYSVENVPLEIVLTNTSKDNLRLLDAFDTSNKKRIFFTVTLRDENGSPFFTSGGGKISFSKNSMKYVDLKRGDQTSVRINLQEYELPSETLKPGIYSVLVTYRNQYGEDCFKGSVKSQPLDLILN